MLDDPNKRQVAGSHYNQDTGLQHWDICELCKVPYLEACASKYISRWKNKNGVEDLEKALHYIEKRIYLTESSVGEHTRGGKLKNFAVEWIIKQDDARLLLLTMFWRSTSDLYIVRNNLITMIREQRGDDYKGADHD